MSRVQLALRVSDLEGSVAFYSKLFNVETAKRRPGYANFAIENPPLKLVLLEGEADQSTVMDHLGVEVASTDEVNATTQRLTDCGLITLEETTPSAATRSKTRSGYTAPATNRGRSTPSKPTLASSSRPRRVPAAPRLLPPSRRLPLRRQPPAADSE